MLLNKHIKWWNNWWSQYNKINLEKGSMHIRWASQVSNIPCVIFSLPSFFFLFLFFRMVMMSFEDKFPYNILHEMKINFSHPLTRSLSHVHTWKRRKLEAKEVIKVWKYVKGFIITFIILCLCCCCCLPNANISLL